MTNHIHAKRKNTEKRYELIRSRFNETMSHVKEATGFHPDMDQVISKVAEEFGYSEVTVKQILKKK